MSVDLFYERQGGAGDGHDGRGDPGDGHDALAVEMEAATLLAVGAASGTPVACVLAVSDTFAPNRERTRISDHELAGRSGGDGRRRDRRPLRYDGRKIKRADVGI